MRSLTKYSTAFTSWLVVASRALTRSASATEKPACTARTALSAATDKGGSSATSGSAAKAANHWHSTWTRKRIKPYSLKMGASASVLAR